LFAVIGENAGRKQREIYIVVLCVWVVTREEANRRKNFDLVWGRYRHSKLTTKLVMYSRDGSTYWDFLF
jgi:hypothetical protein